MKIPSMHVVIQIMNNDKTTGIMVFGNACCTNKSLVKSDGSSNGSANIMEDVRNATTKPIFIHILMI